LVFKVVRHAFSVEKMDTDFEAYCVNLPTVLAWAIREQNLNACSDSTNLEFNIKLDGRPLGGTSLILEENDIK